MGLLSNFYVTRHVLQGFLTIYWILECYLYLLSVTLRNLNMQAVVGHGLGMYVHFPGICALRRDPQKSPFFVLFRYIRLYSGSESGNWSASSLGVRPAFRSGLVQTAFCVTVGDDIVVAQKHT